MVTEIEQIGKNEYKVMATMNLEKVFRTLDFYDEETEATTVGGWVVEKLGRISQEGDAFEFENLSITICKIRSRRVLETLFRVNEEEEESQF